MILSLHLHLTAALCLPQDGLPKGIFSAGHFLECPVIFEAPTPDGQMGQ